ncbi:MAG: ATP-dependent sacrificial sulfur transferase LarE [Lachnospiraceae bacterium]|nr:ATP-dependent sacrificial sulfur transferase LarE [Lachnospiraceae bacterium]
MTLETFFRENPKAAIAFSGGVDSAYLLCAAGKYGAKCRAYYVKSAFQPEFELEDAKRLAKELGADMKILTVDVLSDETVRKNPADRCYYCKQRIFSTILREAAADGYTLILDGTNASDDAGDRPGMRALRELQVRSPLRECGLTKAEIRRLSKEAGLFTWDKPAYACLATRIPAGEEITAEKLIATEKAEGFLFSLGFTDFRVRQKEGTAKLQMRADQLPKLLEKREEILTELSQYYKAVTLDLEVRG